jgi:hypothetical protein
VVTKRYIIRDIIQCKVIPIEAHRFVRPRGSHIFLDNRLTDGSEVSITSRPPFTPTKIPGTDDYHLLGDDTVWLL